MGKGILDVGREQVVVWADRDYRNPFEVQPNKKVDSTMKSTSIAASLCLSITFCSVCVATETVSTEAASGWEQWHGPNRDGKSLETGLLQSWPTNGPALLWTSPHLGRGWSSVSIGGGLIYTTGLKHEGNTYSEEQGTILLTALDMDGKVKWSKDVGPAFVGNHVYQGARATPTYNDGDLYLMLGFGVLGCYDAKTGDTKWQRDIQKDFQAQKIRWQFTESLLVIDDKLIVTPGGTNSFMVALNKKDGKTVWESGPFSPAGYSSPIYVEYEGIPMIINGAYDGIAGVHAETGEILWTNDFAAANMANCPTPSFEDGYVFWAVGYNVGGICLKLSVSGKKVKATEAWRTMDIKTQYGGYVIHDGYIYGNNMYKWSCLELKTGKLMWSTKGAKKASVSYADGMLYLYGINKGHTILLPASPKAVPPESADKKPTPLLKATGEFHVYDKKVDACRANPVICDGRLYTRVDQQIYCFDIKAK